MALCQQIVTLIYDQFTAIQKPNSWRMVYKTYISIDSKFLSYETWKHN